MREFIEELKYNQNINFEKGLENRIDIDYVIERLEDMEISTELYDMLEKADKTNVLTIITMALVYFTKEYNVSCRNAIKIVKKAYKELENNNK